MGKDKKLEDTAELDAKAIRNATSKTKNRKTNKNEYSKGGSRRRKTSVNSFNKPASGAQNRTSQNKKQSVRQSQQKPTSKSYQKPSNKSQQKSARQNTGVKQTNRQNTAKKTVSNEKIRRFPKEEKQVDVKKKSASKKKKRARKIKGIIVFSLVCIMILISVAAVAISQLFKIKTITVNYDLNKATQTEKVKRQYTDEQIINASGVSTGDNLVYLKYAREEKIKQSVGASLPYLTVVSIEEKGLSTLILNVKQIKPSYAFMFGDTYILTDDMMNVIDATQDKETAKKYTIIRYAKVKSYEKGKTVEFNEDNNSSQIDMSSLFSAIKSSGIKKISYISLKDMDDLYMTYDNRITVHIGKPENLTEKLKLAAKSLAKEDENNPSQKGELNLTIDKKAYFTPD